MVVLESSGMEWHGLGVECMYVCMYAGFLDIFKISSEVHSVVV